MAAIKGELLILSIWDNSIYRPIACLTSNNLSETKNVKESQDKCAPGVITKKVEQYSNDLPAQGTYKDKPSASGEMLKQ